MTEKKICIVVAIAENRTIGINNSLPWYLPSDLKQFKKITLGHPIVMGRKTFESIGRPLPGRDNIVVTRQKNWCADGVKVAADLGSAILLAEKSATNSGVDEVMIIGGAEFYRQVLSICNRIYLTEVHARVEGDAFFPELNLHEWEEISRISENAIDGNSHPYSFVVLDRKL